MDNRPRSMKTFKGRTRSQIFESIKEWVMTLKDSGQRNYFSLNEIADELKIKPHKVHLALIELNRKGLVTKPCDELYYIKRKK